MCGRYVVTKPVTKTADLVKTNIKVEDNDNYRRGDHDDPRHRQPPSLMVERSRSLSGELFQIGQKIKKNLNH